MTVRPSHPTSGRAGSMFDQPRAVCAVAFACVIAFMGIGLVDPILVPIAESLQASPSQVSLLFKSYMAVMGVAMLVTGVVSSRFGPKRTLLGGLAIIIVCSGLAGSSDSIGAIVGFRAGWGLGNALFIATALATIVGAASGGVAGSIVLYEAALGVGIAGGPLLGGVLGLPGAAEVPLAPILGQLRLGRGGLHRPDPAGDGAHQALRRCGCQRRHRFHGERGRDARHHPVPHEYRPLPGTPGIPGRGVPGWPARCRASPSTWRATR